MPSPAPDFLSLLRELTDRQVEFIVVGGIGAVTEGRSYEDLLKHAIEIPIAPGLTVKVLTLAWLIRLKEELGRDKDAAVLPILRRTLEEGGKL